MRPAGATSEMFSLFSNFLFGLPNFAWRGHMSHLQVSRFSREAFCFACRTRLSSTVEDIHRWGGGRGKAGIHDYNYYEYTSTTIDTHFGHCTSHHCTPVSPCLIFYLLSPSLLHFNESSIKSILSITAKWITCQLILRGAHTQTPFTLLFLTFILILSL